MTPAHILSLIVNLTTSTHSVSKLSLIVTVLLPHSLFTIGRQVGTPSAPSALRLFVAVAFSPSCLACFVFAVASARAWKIPAHMVDLSFPFFSDSELPPVPASAYGAWFAYLAAGCRCARLDESAALVSEDSLGLPTAGTAHVLEAA
jgi:hypothetical protein